MSRVRTFLAIGLTPEVVAELTALQRTLGRGGGDVKWVEEQNLHLTLLFLGEVDERELISICRAAQDALATQPAFAVSVEKVGCFPNPRRPRTLWAGIGAGSAEVVAVHDALEESLLQLGCYRREARQFTPHITLGRLNSAGVPFKLTEAIAKAQVWQAGESRVDEVLIMSSQLTPSGPVYTILGRAPLT
jgi:2'-5' RNA ligase